MPLLHPIRAVGTRAIFRGALKIDLDLDRLEVRRDFCRAKQATLVDNPSAADLHTIDPHPLLLGHQLDHNAEAAI